jgi:hypothetical protein
MDMISWFLALTLTERAFLFMIDGMSAFCVYSRLFDLDALSFESLHGVRMTEDARRPSIRAVEKIKSKLFQFNKDTGGKPCVTVRYACWYTIY